MCTWVSAKVYMLVAWHQADLGAAIPLVKFIKFLSEIIIYCVNYFKNWLWSKLCFKTTEKLSLKSLLTLLATIFDIAIKCWKATYSFSSQHCCFYHFFCVLATFHGTHSVLTWKDRLFLDTCISAYQLVMRMFNTELLILIKNLKILFTWVCTDKHR